MTFELQYVFSGILLHSYFLTVRISWCRHYGPLSAHFKNRPNWFAQQVGSLNSLANLGPVGGWGRRGGGGSTMVRLNVDRNFLYLEQLTNGMEEGENRKKAEGQNTPPRHVERTGWLDSNHIVYLFTKQHCLTVHSLPRAREAILTHW